MTEETNNAELIIQPQETPKQPENNQPPQQEAKSPEPIDLSKLSLEELQAAIEKKKKEQEEAETETLESLTAKFTAETDPKKKLEIIDKIKKITEKEAKKCVEQSKQGDLVKWINNQCVGFLGIGMMVNPYQTLRYLVTSFPGNLKSFTRLLDKSGSVTSEMVKCEVFDISDVDIESKQTISVSISRCFDYEYFNKILEKF